VTYWIPAVLDQREIIDSLEEGGTGGVFCGGFFRVSIILHLLKEGHGKYRLLQTEVISSPQDI